MKILLCKVDMGNKLYGVKFFELCNKKIELMKQIHLMKIGFVIFDREQRSKSGLKNYLVVVVVQYFLN